MRRHRPASGRVTFTSVLRIGEFRALFSAAALSLAGDNLAKVAVALLVFARSHSPLLTGLSYGLSFLPWLVGGPLLGGLADRYPRRTVLIVCDLSRAALVGLLILPGMPLAALLALITVVSLLEVPFRSARAGLLPAITGEGDTFIVAMNLWGIANTLATAGGLALGGTVVQYVGARAGLGIDVATFLVSAWLTIGWVRDRPVPAGEHETGLRQLTAGIRHVFTHPWPLWLSGAAALMMCSIAAGLAGGVLYVAAEHGSTSVAGLLTAAPVAGAVVGTAIFGRLLPPAWGRRSMLPLALLAPVFVMVAGLTPPVPVLIGFFLLAGVCSAMSMLANGHFVAAIPDELRGGTMGVANAMVAGLQGLAMLGTGAFAEHLGAGAAIATVAAISLGLVVLLTLATLGRIWWRRLRVPRRTGQPVAGSDSSDSRDTSRSTVVGQPEEEPVDRPHEDSQVGSQVKVWLMIAAVIALAGALAYAMRGDQPYLHTDVPVWWIGGLFFVCMVLPLPFRDRLMALTSVPLVIGLYFLSPVELIVASVTGQLAGFLLVGRRGLQRYAFNLGNFGAGTALAVAAFHAASLGSPSIGPRSWPAALLAASVEVIATDAAVLAVAWVATRRWQWREAAGGLSLGWAVAIASGSLAICASAAISYDRSQVWTVSLFVLLIALGMRTYHRLSERHAALDRLLRVAQDIGPLAGEPADLAPALQQLRGLLAADELECALPADDDPMFATVIRVFDDETGAGTMVRQVHLVAPSAPAKPPLLQRLRSAWDRPSPQGGTATEITVGLPLDDQARARLTARRAGSAARRFESADLRLLEASADQLAEALEKGRLITRLRQVAERDALTGLANLDSLRRFLAGALEHSPGAVLVLLDIDRFHEINDTLGHDAGDIVLAEVARRLETPATQGALVARMGSDQFALAIPGQAGSEVARLAALAVKSRIDGALRLGQISADVRVRVGIARAPEHGSDATTLLRRAEMALTLAKTGSGGITEWEPGLEQDGSRRLQLLAALRQALADGALGVEFQPKLRLSDRSVVGFEALVRWRHPELGPVSPAEFVPLTEASGLISALTSNVLRQALEACRTWHDVGLPVGVAVNISARNLDDPVLVGQVAATLTATGVQPHWLTLEITESSVMENHARARVVLDQLRTLGVRLSIDDFGTGYSSLHQLRGLPVDEVKIDKSFVDALGEAEGVDRAVVRAIVDLCESLELSIVAEGVERPAQEAALRDLGVPLVQGYLYGRPMPQEAATDWLAGQHVADVVTD